MSCGQDKSVRVWDMNHGLCLHTMAGHAGYVSDVLALPDGRIVSSGLFDATIRVWSVPPLSSYPHIAQPTTTTASAGGTPNPSTAIVVRGSTGSGSASTLKARCDGVIDTDEHDIACLALLYVDSW